VFVFAVYFTSVSVPHTVCPVASRVIIRINDKGVEGSGRGLIQGAEKTHEVVSVPAEMQTGYMRIISQDLPLQAI
jgi:hypothetical protein